MSSASVTVTAQSTVKSRGLSFEEIESFVKSVRERMDSGQWELAPDTKVKSRTGFRQQLLELGVVLVERSTSTVPNAEDA